ncbi:MAG: HD domain-containing protein [Candidatus Yanofskybacteria bacterium]|nr:HD domain-containing protein [Candidatus Yanofskybacteria bacterium]
MSKLVERAKAFALEAHKGQKRWNREETPMATHIKEVATLVEQSSGNEVEIAAAWLHDVVEDTPVTLAEITANFGNEVAAIVDGLTDLPEFSRMLTLERKTAQARRVSDESDSVKHVKLADQISNVRSVAVDPPAKWDSKKCLDYVNGAELVAWECKDASSRLYGLFCRAYADAVKAHDTGKVKLLFICTANINRSRAGEDLFANSAVYEAKSAGFVMFESSGQALTQGLINWADRVFVMDEVSDCHLTKLRAGFDVQNKDVVVLGIPDKFDRKDRNLSALLKEKLAGHGIEA